MILSFTLLAMKMANIILHTLKGYSSIEDFSITLFDFPDDSISFFKTIIFQRNRPMIMAIDKIFFEYKKMFNANAEVKIQQRFDNKCK